MRQIFEDAGREYIAVPGPRDDLYPQLPNISRKASPFTPLTTQSRQQIACSTVNRRLESLCLPADMHLTSVQRDQSYRDPSRLSQSTSGSWSDDSGYFVASSRSRLSALIIASNERIYDWLQNVSFPKVGSPIEAAGAMNATKFDECQVSARFSPSQTWESPEEQKLFECGGSVYGGEPIVHHSVACHGSSDRVQPIQSSSRNPLTKEFAYDPKRHELSLSNVIPSPAPLVSSSTQGSPAETNVIASGNPMECSPLKDDGPEFSSLSPNVCVERGHSRYHANRHVITYSNTSPSCKQQSPACHQPLQLKENFTSSHEMPATWGQPTCAAT